jgi:hypothetical protein
MVGYSFEASILSELKTRRLLKLQTQNKMLQTLEIFTEIEKLLKVIAAPHVPIYVYTKSKWPTAWSAGIWTNRASSFLIPEEIRRLQCDLTHI